MRAWAAALGAGTAAVVAAAVDRAGRRSGATDAEVRARLPGDDIVSRPTWSTPAPCCGACGGGPSAPPLTP